MTLYTYFNLQNPNVQIMCFCLFYPLLISVISTLIFSTPIRNQRHTTNNSIPPSTHFRHSFYFIQPMTHYKSCTSLRTRIPLTSIRRATMRSIFNLIHPDKILPITWSQLMGLCQFHVGSKPTILS